MLLIALQLSDVSFLFREFTYVGIVCVVSILQVCKVTCVFCFLDLHASVSRCAVIYQGRIQDF